MGILGFIGGGSMAEALIKGLLGSGRQPGDLMVSDKDKKRLSYLKDTYGVKTVEKNNEITGLCDTVILAVKPQNLEEAVGGLSVFPAEKVLLISILAGVSTKRLEGLLPEGARVVRAMPNTPALIRQGITVISAGSKAGEDDIKEAAEIFSVAGRVHTLPENLLNAVTGLSGSGPAFVFLIIEALADGGVMAGLPRDVAYSLAAETVKGAAAMVSETKMHPGQLKDMVTSPAGTTIYGMLELEKAGVRGTIMETVMAATRRAGQL